MVVPAHTLVTVTGVYGSVAAPIEDWSFSLKFGLPIPNVTLTQMQTMCNSIRNAYGTHMASALPTSCSTTRLRVASIEEFQGRNRVARTQGGEYIQADNVSSFAHTGSNNTVLPLQTALVVSLTSTRGGPTGKGRFFLPWPGYALSADYRITDAQATASAQSVRTWINAIKTLEWATGNALGPPIVASSKGYVSTVTGLRVGRAPDTMRSRRGDNPEGYYSVQL